MACPLQREISWPRHFPLWICYSIQPKRTYATLHCAFQEQNRLYTVAGLSGTRALLFYITFQSVKCSNIFNLQLLLSSSITLANYFLEVRSVRTSIMKLLKCIFTHVANMQRKYKSISSINILHLTLFLIKSSSFFFQLKIYIFVLQCNFISYTSFFKWK